MDSPICIADCKAILGEGPVWVEREQALYWLDIEGRRIFRRSGDGQVREWAAPFKLGSLAPRAAGGFIAGTAQGLAFVDPGAELFEIFADPEEALPENRFNDGKVDRQGRFWAGTMDGKEKEASGTLYRIGADLAPMAVDKGYRVTNGPAFSRDGRLMYHNDSARQLIYLFDLEESGEASNRRLFKSFGEGDGYPDGMTVDAEDCLWVAFWDGWCLRRFSPSGELLLRLDLPVQRPTSCAFGGPALEQLYITSAKRGFEEAELEKQPQAGGLFLVNPGVAGIAEQPFAG
jgi:sugar lactone lactonase YvrE